MGGSDQWGNIVNGIELSRRIDGAELFGATTPLITKADGSKMGKSVSGAIWLNEDQLSSYDYWQFWRNTDDADVGRFLKLFTDLPLDEIARLEALGGAEINDAKKTLANEATTMLHGREAAVSAEATARAAFEEGSVAGALAGLPIVSLPAADVRGMSNTALMVAVGFASSNSDARRQIAGGAFRINGVKVSDAEATVAIDGLEAELRKGKTRVRLSLEEETNAR
jgi:tyrosyl-tRNA synthetase